MRLNVQVAALAALWACAAASPISDKARRGDEVSDAIINGEISREKRGDAVTDAIIYIPTNGKRDDAVAEPIILYTCGGVAC